MAGGIGAAAVVVLMRVESLSRFMRVPGRHGPAVILAFSIAISASAVTQQMSHAPILVGTAVATGIVVASMFVLTAFYWIAHWCLCAGSRSERDRWCCDHRSDDVKR